MPWCTVGNHEFLGIYVRSSSWCGQCLYLPRNLADPVRINFFRTLEINLGVVAHTCNSSFKEAWSGNLLHI